MARAQAEVIPNRPAPALQSFPRNDTIRPNRNAPLPGFPVREKEANHMSMNTVPERLAALRAAMAANGVRVVFGSKDAVEAAKDLFDTVETL